MARQSLRQGDQGKRGRQAPCLGDDRAVAGVEILPLGPKVAVHDVAYARRSTRMGRDDPMLKEVLRPGVLEAARQRRLDRPL